MNTCLCTLHGEHSWQVCAHCAFQILGWDPSAGAPDSIHQIKIKSNLPLKFFHAPLCLLPSAFFLLAPDQIWLGSVAGDVSICSQCPQTWLWVSRAGFHRNQDSPAPNPPTCKLLVPIQPGFTFELHTNSWTACVACASSQSELRPSGAGGLLRLVPDMQTEPVSW